MKVDILDVMHIPTENLLLIISSINSKLLQKLNYKFKEWKMFSFEQKRSFVNQKCPPVTGVVFFSGFLFRYTLSLSQKPLFILYIYIEL